MIITQLPPLAPKCENNQFLTKVICDKGFHSNQLAALNHCHLRLQVTTVADITGGWENHILKPEITGNKKYLSPLPHHWPKQPPSTAQWVLCQLAISKVFTTNTSALLTYPLDSWTITPNSWNWYWSAQDDHIYKCLALSWQVWIPQLHTWYYGQQFKLLDTVHNKKLHNPQLAIVKPTNGVIVFLGAYNIQKIELHKKYAFNTFIMTHPEAPWLGISRALYNRQW